MAALWCRLYLFKYIYMALFSLDITQPLVAITASSNTHTIDFDAPGNNYSITANNATKIVTINPKTITGNNKCI